MHIPDNSIGFSLKGFIVHLRDDVLFTQTVLGVDRLNSKNYFDILGVLNLNLKKSSVTSPFQLLL